MRKLFFLFCVFVLLPYTSFGADTSKIAVVDVQKVLNDSTAGKKAKVDLEALIQSKQAHIDEQGKTIEKMKTDIDKQASVLSPEARQTKEDELEKLIREYQRLVQDSQTEVKKKEGELTGAILKEVNDLVIKIGEKEGYAVILERGMVLYSHKDLDITDKVIKEYDESKK
jgi:outer membrane protein